MRVYEKKKEICQVASSNRGSLLPRPRATVPVHSAACFKVACIGRRSRSASGNSKAARCHTRRTIAPVSGCLRLRNESLAPEHRELLRNIAASGERAAELTRRLLAFSRKQRLMPQPTNLTDLVAGTELIPGPK